MTAQNASRRQGIARLLPWHLSVAWLTVAFLYLAHPGWLPSPFFALVISTLIAVAAAGLLFAQTRQVPAAPPLRSTDPGADRPGSVDVEPTPVKPAAVAAKPLDLHDYAAAGADERQCPQCGGFDVRAAPDGSAACRTCQFVWREQHQPTVVIRSWLHQQ
jgi:hypothetical protein